jgi:hypothetical protein
MPETCILHVSGSRSKRKSEKAWLEVVRLEECSFSFPFLSIFDPRPAHALLFDYSREPKSPFFLSEEVTCLLSLCPVGLAGAT